MSGTNGALFDAGAEEAAQPTGRRGPADERHIPIRRVYLIRDVWIEHDFAQWLETFRVSFNRRSKVWTLEDLWINDRVPDRSTVRLDSAEAVVWAIVGNLAEQEAGLRGGLAAVEEYQRQEVLATRRR